MEKMKMYKEVGGVRVLLDYSEESFLSGMNYKAKPGDLFLVSYPKCGTTWMHHIVNLILHKGQPFEDPLDLLAYPFIEIVGAEYIEMTKPKAMRTHLPFSAIPFSPESKYIYTIRNPRDCCVSFYHFIKFLSISQKELSFHEFFEAFLDGNLLYGDYFDHLLGWYEHKNDDNVHFVTYEDLKKDIKAEILKIAKFIGEEYEKSILSDPKIMENIIHYSSFDYMKESSKKNIDVFFQKDKTWLENKNIPPGTMKIVQNLNKTGKDTKSGTLVRKGIVGDWKNHFNEEQIRLLNEKIVERTKDSDVMNLWKDIFENN